MTEGCKIEEIITKNYAIVPAEILLPVAAKMMNKKGWDPASDIGKALLNGLSKCAEKQHSTVMTDPNWLQLLCDNKLIKAKDLDAYFDEAEKQEVKKWRKPAQKKRRGRKPTRRPWSNERPRAIRRMASQG